MPESKRMDPIVEKLDGILLTLEGKEGGVPKAEVLPALISIVKEMYLVQKEIRREVCPPDSFITDRDVPQKVSGNLGT